MTGFRFSLSQCGLTSTFAFLLREMAPFFLLLIHVGLENRAYFLVRKDGLEEPLTKHLDSHYYVAALSAAQYHGASHQKPMQYQVCVSKNLRNIEADSQSIKFILNEDVAWVPTVQKKIASGYITFSSLAVTCYDLVRYPQLAGGINNTATCLYELLEESKDSLADFADVRFKTNILQRLGCILERVELEKPALTLEKILKNRPLHWTPLVRGQTTKGSIKNTKWMILENETLEPDL